MSKPGMRTAAVVTWEAAEPKYHCLCWRYLCSIEGIASACIAASPGVAAARAAAVAAAAAAGVAAARGGAGPHEAIRPSRWWSTIV